MTRSSRERQREVREFPVDQDIIPSPNQKSIRFETPQSHPTPQPIASIPPLLPNSPCDYLIKPPIAVAERRSGGPPGRKLKATTPQGCARAVALHLAHNDLQVDGFHTCKSCV